MLHMRLCNMPTIAKIIDISICGKVPRKTHIDRLLERKAISKKEHATLKAQEAALRAAKEHAAAKIAKRVIHKAKMLPNS